ncbi:hypothetical protein ACQEVY_24630 [Streptomyces sp. CA-288835]|uniref:hypothetical protein n=1 Tax=Streptomyces sp. CA-288835 TaxID=3240069 RepID=UPI003D932D69
MRSAAWYLPERTAEVSALTARDEAAQRTLLGLGIETVRVEDELGAAGLAECTVRCRRPGCRPGPLPKPSADQTRRP